jgi:HSP20 family molecular chaperone IbpA
MKNSLTTSNTFSFPTAQSILNNMSRSLDSRFDLLDRILDEWPVGNSLTFKDIFLNENGPYDLEKTDFGYRITVALAGFSKDEVSVKLSNDKVLEISAEKKDQRDETNLIHKKISYRNKKYTFSVIKGSEIVANLKDGLLTVDIHNPKKEDKKENVKMIEIS